LNEKIVDKLDETEIMGTIMVTVAKAISKRWITKGVSDALVIYYGEQYDSSEWQPSVDRR
jgi:hypothetical protein